MSLSEKQLRYLRGRAHPLKPVIQIGQHGLTAGVCAETTRALADHELIKVRVQGAERTARDQLIAELAQQTASELVTRIGHTAVLFKARTPLSRIPLPEA
ncbi:MAG TPA: ribosome assembly RNA-binding protein YhbY [Steroidobacteraceae bacterium]|jgi:RNA-binding protein